MPHWAAKLGPELTDEEIKKLRERAVEYVGETEFTCDDCRDRRTCEWAFDPYNTNGDCLAEK